MPIRSSIVLAVSACLSAALLTGCAGGGSSVAHAAAALPASAQQGTLAGAAACAPVFAGRWTCRRA